ncbi:MAG: 1-acyl-sn-glycerol-3-phosphate acyltransferase, partial [Pyrinomonadaceae bacterium]|nr:1-acyl-sn-glycerol-3-phosphate acyltransferase [Pyrinomonadaceae bacterium]
RLFATIVSKILWQIEFHSTENIPQQSSIGLVVVANHQTYLDPFWICIPIKRKFRFMAWEKAFDWFIIGRLIKYLGAFPVNVERGTKQALKQAIEAISDGAALVVFPEGTRELSDGKLLPFKTGAIRIAIKTATPILPVTIQGANKVWARDMKLPRPWGKIKVFYHKVIETKGLSENDIDSLTKKLEQIIQSKMK